MPIKIGFPFRLFDLETLVVSALFEVNLPNSNIPQNSHCNPLKGWQQLGRNLATSRIQPTFWSSHIKPQMGYSLHFCPAIF